MGADILEIAPHALARYVERVDPAASPVDAEAAIRAAWRGARRLHSQGRDTALYDVEGGAYRLVVRTQRGQRPAVISVIPPTAVIAGEDWPAPVAAPPPSLPVAAPLPPWVEPSSIEEALARHAAALARARALEPQFRTVARAARAVLQAEYTALHGEQRRLTTWIRAAMPDRDAVRDSANLRAAWRLLLKCTTHVPGELAAAIADLVPAGFAAREVPRG